MVTKTAIMAGLLSVLSFIASPATGQEGASNRRISDDVEFRQYSVDSPAGSVSVHMVLIDQDALRSGRLSIEPATGGDLVGQCASPETIARRVDALAAINGPYYASAGDRIYPLGFTAIDGRLVQLGSVRRPMVGINPRGEFKIAVAHPQAFVTSDTYFEPLFLWGIDEPAGRDNVTLYDRRWGDSVSSQDGTAVIVDPYVPESGGVIVIGPGGPERTDWDGVVADRSSSGPVAIPEDGFVLVFRGQSLSQAERYQRGAKISIYTFELPSGWERMRWIATLGPWFLHEGNRRDYSGETRYGSNITGRANRSVIGTTWNDEVFFAVTSGAGVSVGEATEVFMECNAREAVMCDSGSSSGLWADGVGAIRSGSAVPLAFVVRELTSPPVNPEPLKVWTGTIHRN